MLPLLLFPKPILLYLKHAGKPQQKQPEQVGNELSEGLVEKEEKPAAGGHGGHGHGDHFDFGEICVH